MSSPSRRDFLTRGSLGLAALAAGGLALRAGAQATPQSGELGAYGRYLDGEAAAAPAPAPGGEPAAEREPAAWAATEDNILGPYYREGAPYRGKVTPPLEPGTVLLVTGRVWGLDTRRPLAGAVIDLWQANTDGRYDNDDPRNPPREDVFINRARVVTDAQGRYEFESIHPGAYRLGRDAWRPPHVHYLVRHRGYKPLITQLYFRGDPHQERDPFIKPSLIIALEERRTPAGSYEVGAFDIVLLPE